MIIAALANYYEQLRRDHPDEVARPGWTSCKVKYQLVISEDGVPVKLIPAAEKNGVERLVPVQEKSAHKPNFLCNKARFIFGLNAQGWTKSSIRCFEASKAKHEKALQGVDSPVARAILGYYDVWNPKDQSAGQVLGSEFQDACADGYLTFALLTNEGVLLCAEEDDLIAAAWDAAESEPDVTGDAMVCLATGVLGTPARVHPLIKGLPGAHPAGSSLVSFNAPAFESYGHAGKQGQGRNAPVGEKTAQAYGSALNYLLSNRSHHLRMGDTTVVFWSERADAGNTDLFSLLLGGRAGDEGSDGAVIDKNLESILENMRSGKPVDTNGVEFGSTFYVLGLAPNNSRLAVRFFLKGEFGDMLANICAHYRRIEVAHGQGSKSVLTPYWLLKAVENQESKNLVISSELVSPLIKAILNGGRYPEALFSNTLLRVKATREVRYEQAAIIRGYLIRNCGRSEEEVTVELNEVRNDTAYNLGRAFSYLGQIQEAANDKDTLTGHYLDSACTRPAMVFPTLLKLSNNHLEKLAKSKPRWAVALERGLMSTLSEGRVDAFPKQLSLAEQGDFMLGYYHQKESRYQKKSDQAATETITKEA